MHCMTRRDAAAGLFIFPAIRHDAIRRYTARQLGVSQPYQSGRHEQKQQTPIRWEFPETNKRSAAVFRVILITLKPAGIFCGHLSSYAKPMNRCVIDYKTIKATQPEIISRIIEIDEESQNCFREMDNLLRSDQAVASFILRVANSPIYNRS